MLCSGNVGSSGERVDEKIGQWMNIFGYRN